jgi:transposase-like protein
MLTEDEKERIIKPYLLAGKQVGEIVRRFSNSPDFSISSTEVKNVRKRMALQYLRERELAHKAKSYPQAEAVNETADKFRVTRAAIYNWLRKK